MPHSKIKDTSYKSEKEVAGKVEGDVIQIDSIVINLDSKEFEENLGTWEKNSILLQKKLKEYNIPKTLDETKKIKISKDKEKEIRKIESVVRKVLRKIGKPAGDVDLYLRLGCRAYAIGLVDPAIEWFEKALQIDPENIDALKNMGLSLMEKGKYEEAIEFFDAVLDREDSDVEAWKNKGICLDEIERYDEAIRCYDMALSIDSEKIEIWNNKGVCFDRKGKYKEALKCFNKALEINNGVAELWNNKGIIFYRMGKYKEAIDCFNRGLKIDDSIAEIWHNKGVCLKEMGKYKEAIKCYKEALSIIPPEKFTLYEFIEKNKKIAEGLYESVGECSV